MLAAAARMACTSRLDSSRPGRSFTLMVAVTFGF
jgi:hypothetical protein